MSSRPNAKRSLTSKADQPRVDRTRHCSFPQSAARTRRVKKRSRHLLGNGVSNLFSDCIRASGAAQAARSGTSNRASAPVIVARQVSETCLRPTELAETAARCRPGSQVATGTIPFAQHSVAARVSRRGFLTSTQHCSVSPGPVNALAAAPCLSPEYSDERGTRLL
jgi:hypothetical protein